GVHLARDLLGRPRGCSLEYHVLHKVRDAVDRRLFIARARTDPRTHRHAPDMGHRLRQHGQSVRQNSLADVPVGGISRQTAIFNQGYRHESPYPPFFHRGTGYWSCPPARSKLHKARRKPRSLTMSNKINTVAEASPQAKPLFGQSLDALTHLMAGLGQRPYRANQLIEAVYRQRVGSLDEITTLPAALRDSLASEGYAIGLPEIVQTARSVDGTERYLIRMADGETVETVWMPDGDGGERGDGSVAAEEEEKEDANPAFPYRRATICISSQVGCAVNCQFCLTAKLGIRRNLTPGEIAGQVAAVLNRHRVDLGSSRGNPSPARINLVFMGMGEPFLNYANFMKTRLIRAGLGFPRLL